MAVRRRWKRSILALVLIVVSVSAIFPVWTVKGVVNRTGLRIGAGGLSIDAGRAAFNNGTLLSNSVAYLDGYIVIYDISSGSSTSFLPPAGIGPTAGFSYSPVLNGDKIVVGSTDSSGNTFGISYCVLPHTVSLSPCGPWTLLVSNPDPSPPFSFKGDLIVWGCGMSCFSYYRFSSSSVTTVTAPGFVDDSFGGLFLNTLSTNGQTIAFTAKPTPSSTSRTLMYYDTLASPPVIVDTSLPAGMPISCGCDEPGGRTFIWNNLILFNDNSTSQNRIRYYDILSGLSSPAGSGPVGILGLGDTSVWGNRAVFLTSESDLNQDCGANPGVQAGEYCFQYWNLHPRSFQVSLLAPSASPIAYTGVGGTGLAAVPIGISADTVFFAGPDGTLQYVRVPIKGDVSLDGKVDVIDLSEVLVCYGRSILTSSESPCNET